MSRNTYKATEPGYLSQEGRYVKEGEIFSTDAPQGSWMEPITDGEVNKETKRRAAVADEEKDGKTP